jgi:hypothetical protein
VHVLFTHVHMLLAIHMHVMIMCRFLHMFTINTYTCMHRRVYICSLPQQLTHHVPYAWCTQVHPHIHKWVRMHVQPCMHIHLCMCMSMCVCVHVSVLQCVYCCAHIRACVFIWVCVCVCLCPCVCVPVFIAAQALVRWTAATRQYSTSIMHVGGVRLNRGETA